MQESVRSEKFRSHVHAHNELASAKAHGLQPEHSWQTRCAELSESFPLNSGRNTSASATL